MPQLPEPLERLIQELSRLPGIGPKTAQRLAFHLLRAERERVERLAEVLVDLKARLGWCERCFNIAEGPLCVVCSSGRRDETVICVVEAPLDVLAVERTGEYRGMFHVLHGVLSPIDNVGPEDIHVPELLQRLAGGEVQEVIVATNPDIEGEATSLYLTRLLKPMGLKVTRLAQGIPMGGDLEYADQATLARAISARREL